MGIVLWRFSGVGSFHEAAFSCWYVTVVSPSDTEGSGSETWSWALGCRCSVHLLAQSCSAAQQHKPAQTVYRRKTFFFFFLITSKCYNLGMRTHVKEIGSLGCRDTRLIPSNPANSCWNPNLGNQSPHVSLESAQGMLVHVVFFLTWHTLCAVPPAPGQVEKEFGGEGTQQPLCPGAYRGHSLIFLA